MASQPGIRRPFNLIASERSGLRILLSLLPIPAQPVVVDVGAGGNRGVATTDHLVDLGGTIIGIHPHEDICAALRRKYGAELEVIEGFYGKDGVGRPFDVIIIDTMPGFSKLDELLAFAASDGLRPGGYALCNILLDVTGVYERKNPLFDAEQRPVDEEFNRRYFGKVDVDVETVARRFQRHEEYEFIGIAERWTGDDGLYWLVLQRRSESGATPERSRAEDPPYQPALRPRPSSLEAAERLEHDPVFSQAEDGSGSLGHFRRLSANAATYWQKRRPGTGIVLRLRRLVGMAK
jgi:hypothetical protein